MLKIMQLTGLSATAAGTILFFIDAASFVALIVTLTGIGISAAAAILSWKWTIKYTLKKAGRRAAIIL